MARELTDEEKQKLDELRTKYGEITYLGARGRLVVARKPTLAESSVYQDSLVGNMAKSSGKRGKVRDVKLADSKRTFALNCIVFPETRSDAAAFCDSVGFAIYDKLVDKIEALAESEIEDFEGN